MKLKKLHECWVFRERYLSKIFDLIWATGYNAASLWKVSLSLYTLRKNSVCISKVYIHIEVVEAELDKQKYILRIINCFKT